MNRFQQFRRQGKDKLFTMHPIVELVGQSRLLIENHQGVLSYATSNIEIKVSYGCINITGNDLQLMEMSRVKLAVCGRIDGLQLLKR